MGCCPRTDLVCTIDRYTNTASPIVNMKKTRHTPNQIIAELRKVKAAQPEDGIVADLVRDIGVTEQTDYL